jgi:hypothetical protein
MVQASPPRRSGSARLHIAAPSELVISRNTVNKKSFARELGSQFAWQQIS